MQKAMRLYLNDEKKEEFKLDPLLAQILSKRGINTEDAVQRFLYNGLDDLFDPLVMKDIKKAALRILKAISNKERIIVFGDYDVDGITSTALLYLYLKRKFNIVVDYYLPNRHKEGYGLNLPAVKSFVENNYNLLITVDCGITAVKEVSYGMDNGLDVIVTDHHQPGEDLPEAVSVVDPYQEDDSYPFKSLAGVGVAFKLCQSLEFLSSGQRFNKILENLMDIVSLGTVADIVPLLEENRIIVKKGLLLMEDSKNIGLRSLIDRVGLKDKSLTPGQISYIIAPPLNAAGRVEDPGLGIKLLITDDINEAGEIADRLVQLNSERQKIEGDILKEAINMVEEEIDLSREKAIVLYSTNWHHGVIGIVASKLVERYYRPTILIACDEGIGRGSCRSIKGLNIYQALSNSSDYLEEYGGHAMAAGITINQDDIVKFRTEFNDYLDSILDDEDLIPELNVDALLTGEEINKELYNKLKLLEPYGVANPRPRFLLNRVELDKLYQVGKNKQHLKFTLSNGVEGIGFGFGSILPDLKGKKVDLACQIDINMWQGKEKIQLNLEEFSIREKASHYPVSFESGNWEIVDKRNCLEVFDYLNNLLSEQRKVAVFLNNSQLCRKYIKRLADVDIFLAGSKKEVDNFKRHDSGSILFFNNLKNLENIRISDLVFISLPFSMGEMADIIKNYILKKRVIHLLYGQREYDINNKIIKNRLPVDKYLRKLYLYLRAFACQEIFIEDLNKAIVQNESISTNKILLGKGITILSEIGLLKKKNGKLTLLPISGEKLDLSDSISYNNNIDIIEKFRVFSNLAFNDNVFNLVYYLKEYIGGNSNES
ncbi:MAG: single-stranded-DNA-specific exonuclease RecJ [Firmicutes bacterium]|nr:single-stranded-DNA-specific exonuclease RecJ [Bacillota bacterium]